MTTKVTLRRKPITQGRESLYLDFYPAIRCRTTMKLVYKEYLGIYIYQNPQNPIQREYNDEMLLKAEGIRAIRVQAIINEEFGFLDRHKMKGDFLAYFRNIALRKGGKWMGAYRHFEKFVNGSCSFGEVTVDSVRRFGQYLQTAHQLKFTKKKMKQNSAAGYFSTFRVLLKIAYRDKLIRENINDFLEKTRIRGYETGILDPRRVETAGRNPLRNSGSPPGRNLLLFHGSSDQRHPATRMAAYLASLRRRLVDTYPHRENRDRGDAAGQRRSVGVLW